MLKSIRVLLLLTVVISLCHSCPVDAQSAADRIKRMDKNNDGKLSKEEFPRQFQNRFDLFDTDGDGLVTEKEFTAAMGSRNRSRTEREKPADPTHKDVKYGEHAKQAFDIWLAKADDGKPTPLVIYIHGGGFRGGDKSGANNQPINDYLNAGISFASMNYCLSDVGSYPIMMHDAARGLQLIRSKAKEWNLDSEQIACYGGSAGAGISLWLGFHDDLADSKSDDPIARQSTRIVAAGTQNGQSTYDMRTYREWFEVPDLPPHPALAPFYGVKESEDWQSPRVVKLMEDASAINHLTKDDPPVFMTYGKGDVPVDVNSSPGLWVHHARLGIKLKEAMDKLDLECHVVWPQHESEKYDDLHAFLRDKLQPSARQKGDRRTGRRAGRTNAKGEYYAPPALEERVDSPLEIGDKAPDFTLPQVGLGDPVTLSKLSKQKPVVLVFGSITCGPFRNKVVEVFDLHEKYEKQAEFVMIYIREAHPESTILFPTSGGATELKKFVQTDRFDVRTANAKSCTELLHVPFPLLVDEQDNATLKAYGAWPNRLVVVGTDGRVKWDSGPGPRGFQPDKLEKWLKENLSR